MSTKKVKGKRITPLWHIKDRIVASVIAFMAAAVIILVVINSVKSAQTMRSSAESTITLEATNNGKMLDEWLSRQGATVETMKMALQNMPYDDTDAIEDYLEDCLAANPSALMYYVCYDFDGGVFPADHSVIDLDPTTRSWWIDAQVAGHLIYTEPYQDFTTGTMIVSAVSPYICEGHTCAVLADISLSEVVNTVNGITQSENSYGFLLGSDGAVVADQINALSADTSSEIEKVNALTGKVTESVRKLTEESSSMLEFVSTDVIRDYGVLTELAGNYRNDAEFYAKSSSDIGSGSEGLAGSVQTINGLIESLNRSQHEINEVIDTVNGNVQNMTSDSKNTATEVEDVMERVGSLKETVGRFHLD